MVELNKLSPAALKAAMTGGTAGWGEHGSIWQERYAQKIPSTSRRRCSCCGKRATHLGMANGIALSSGCELRIARWVRDPSSVLRRPEIAGGRDG